MVAVLVAPAGAACRGGRRLKSSRVVVGVGVPLVALRRRADADEGAAAQVEVAAGDVVDELVREADHEERERRAEVDVTAPTTASRARRRAGSRACRGRTGSRAGPRKVLGGEHPKVAAAVLPVAKGGELRAEDGGRQREEDLYVCRLASAARPRRAHGAAAMSDLDVGPRSAGKKLAACDARTQPPTAPPQTWAVRGVPWAMKKTAEEELEREPEPPPGRRHERPVRVVAVLEHAAEVERAHASVTARIACDCAPVAVVPISNEPKKTSRRPKTRESTCDHRRRSTSIVRWETGARDAVVEVRRVDPPPRRVVVGRALEPVRAALLLVQSDVVDFKLVREAFVAHVGPLPELELEHDVHRTDRRHARRRRAVPAKARVVDRHRRQPVEVEGGVRQLAARALVVGGAVRGGSKHASSRWRCIPTVCQPPNRPSARRPQPMYATLPPIVSWL